MKRHLPFLLMLLISSVALGGGHDGPMGKAVLLENFGNHHHAVTTKSKDAQRFFDQGLTLCYAFNHEEAIRSFTEAARLDPNCAMAYWGVAYAYGANINIPMSDEAVPKAYAALKKAQELAPKASKREAAYIHALGKRYSDKPVKDRAPMDRAFADAMREVAKSYPDDLDVQTLFAEALMTTMPWNYWAKEGTPRPGTEEVLAALESVLKRAPNHPGACHYYIHAVEASPNPERGLAAAHRLRDLVPGAGHLVHMPSHIYLRLGNYHEATLCNERAIAADEAYITRYKVKGVYASMYYGHNIHFLAYSLSMEGRREEAIRNARKVADKITREDINHMAMLQWIKPTPILTLIRFGQWDEVLREPIPPAEALYEAAISHFGRGLAFARKQQAKEAESELARLNKIAANKAIPKLEMPDFPGESLIKIAQMVLAAEVAGLDGRQEGRVRMLGKAVEMQDVLPYMEPPFWFFPIRQMQGAALIQYGKNAAAEKVYRDDLQRNPANGWSLFGLLQALQGQGKTEAAHDVERRYRDAWKYADTTLTASFY
jgi:tetratricopeptide (TPR) repeat protein